MKNKDFLIGGQLPVRRLGFGAMRITGPGIWGPPTDREEALRVLRELPALGVNFIDTADSYGPRVSEELIREALFPYAEGLVIATKAGLTRSGPDRWTANGDPDYLIEQAHASRERLKVERIDLWQLHRIDPSVPANEQFDAVRVLLDTGVIARAGLSEVSVADIIEAQEYFDVATVQNRYNFQDRGSEDVLDFCEENGIGFIPWYPLAAGGAAGIEILERIGKKYDATAAQVAIAWLLHRSRVVLPIPGTSRVSHLRENMAAANITLSQVDLAELDKPPR
ncbi:oxidoreductase [Herbaspirillum frisingense]|uniref:aldo/keto reductase n=1 Tax=Herbaspirillum frisingense TaxID=92645 RepID=UPI0015FF2403|nr:aldo/keto reductase [Herbaspirillum frisingense]QNB06726.1 oxidoreductase [Herbaspirillum frisingense]